MAEQVAIHPRWHPSHDDEQVRAVVRHPGWAVLEQRWRARMDQLAHAAITAMDAPLMERVKLQQEYEVLRRLVERADYGLQQSEEQHGESDDN